MRRMGSTRTRGPEISVHNRQRSVRVDLGSLRSFAHRALEQCRKLPERKNNLLRDLDQIVIVLISDRKMAELHVRFMNVAGPTDVITFQHGEIFLSAATASRQAREIDTSTGAELRLYLVHGLLHLCGFDDTERVAAREMNKTQRKILSLDRGRER